MATPIDSLRTMSVQARAALKREGMTSLEQAAAQEDDTLLLIPGFGRSSLSLLRTWQKDPQAAMIRSTGSSPLADHLRKVADEVGRIETEAARAGISPGAAPLRVQKAVSRKPTAGELAAGKEGA